MQPVNPPDPKRADGRYYKSLDELLSLGTDKGVFYGSKPDEPPRWLMPLSTQYNDPLARFAEEQWRFTRMANMITVRSDLFEIIATVQAGYGTDANGDGEINWRSNDEFVTTAEKKVRTIYER